MKIMLPELLFSVGNSMQDISRDDFNLLNGACDKDVSAVVRSNSPLPPTTPSPTPGYNASNSPHATASVSPNLDASIIKLENSPSDLYTTPSWHHPHHTEVRSNKLLRNSDDPLISRGATSVDDDNPNELNSIVAAASTANQMNSPTTPTITVTTPTSQKKNKNAGTSGSRTRRKGTFKLRFHHQALPAEYLNHYEATQNQQNKVNNSSHNSNKKTNETNTHETVRSWLQKISEMQITSNELKETMDVTESLPEGQNVVGNLQKSPRRVVKYSDLPYMGEMTLENSKPRRGRKPKKADICHLIYKNYGTIFPGTPKDLVDAENCEENKKFNKKIDHSDITKEIRTRDEPLNLCLRDQSGESLTISSEGEDSDEQNISNRSTPLTTPTDPATDALLAANLKMSLPNFQTAMLDKSPEEPQTPSTGDSEKTSSPNYVYWPNAGIFIHPMALYYQKMINSGALPVPAQTAPPITPSTLPPQSPAASKKQQTPKHSPKLSPKNTPPTIKKEKSEQRPEVCSTPSSTKSTNSTTTNSTSLQGHPQPPQKRKRSAIFIPPIPAENTTNPATEVSICKFKFTGGAKPTLQEKKMLSVDSDGNYRFYSGTGDKSMRGYEFFPRESLQQSGVLPGVNCSGTFSNSTGEKVTNDIPPPSAGLSNELLQIPDSPPGGILLPRSGTPPASSTSSAQHHRQLSAQNNERRKRKSRRSLQRERLEQTFKEKGFLIQTQQLESAEGATYCKFRQLRKFTRYLFRSWKDYLPGELQQANAAAAAAAVAANNSSNLTTTNHQQQHQQQQQQHHHKTVIEKSRKN